jgi:hypothetical protein
MFNRLNDYVSYKLPDWKAITDFGPAIDLESYRRRAKDEKWFRTRLVDFHWRSHFPFSFPPDAETPTENKRKNE